MQLAQTSLCKAGSTPVVLAAAILLCGRDRPQGFSSRRRKARLSTNVWADVGAWAA
jgi:hypothetical protein